MSEPFTLTAIPGVLRVGEDKGHLEFVTFVAQNGAIEEKWTGMNVGTFADDFAQIVDAGTAVAILRRLRSGEKVVFPGFWHLEEIKDRFGGNGRD
jgi:hypothetical protein